MIITSLTLRTGEPPLRHGPHAPDPAGVSVVAPAVVLAAHECTKSNGPAVGPGARLGIGVGVCLDPVPQPDPLPVLSAQLTHQTGALGEVATDSVRGVRRGVPHNLRGHPWGRG